MENSSNISSNPNFILSIPDNQLKTASADIGKDVLLSPIPPCPPLPLHLQNIREIDIAYYRLTRRVPKEFELDKKLELLPNKEYYIPILLENLEQRNWVHEIFKNPDYPFYALAAVKDGKLAVFEFSTLMLYWAAVKDNVSSSDQVESVPFFQHGGSVNPRAIELIKRTMRVYGNTIETFVGGTFCSAKHIEMLIEKMKKAPPSEQQFFLIPQTEHKEKTITKAIQDVRINIFLEVTDASLTKKRMIPSLTLMQSFLDAKFGLKSRRINPVIGVSYNRDIAANGCFFERDMAIPFPDIKLPKLADNFLAPGTEFSYHDFYHTFIVSAIPLGHSPAFIRAADCVRGALSNLNPHSQFYSGQLVDMEASNYREDFLWHEFTANDNFWIEMIFQLFPNYKITIQKIDTFKPLAYVLSDILLHPEDWKSEFGIHLNLKNLYRLGIKKFFSLEKWGALKPFWKKMMWNFLLAQDAQSFLMQGKDVEASLVLKKVRSYSHNEFFMGFTDMACLEKAISHYMDASRSSIDLSGCKILADKHLEAMSKHKNSNYIRDINLTGCTLLTGEVITSLKAFNRLEKLSLSGCSHLVNSLHKLSPNIKSLDLSGIRALTDDHLTIIYKTCPFLEILNIDRCLNITDTGLRNLVFNSRISKIHIHKCTKITKEIVARLKEEQGERVSLIDSNEG